MGCNPLQLLKSLVSFRKKDKDPFKRRPENQSDREKLLAMIGEAHRRGDVNDKDFNKLYTAAMEKLTDQEIRTIVGQVATLASICGSVATVAGFVITGPGNTGTEGGPEDQGEGQPTEQQDFDNPDHPDNPDNPFNPDIEAEDGVF